MDWWKILLVVVFSAILLGGIVAMFIAARKKPGYSSTKMIAVVGVFGAMSTILYAVPVFKFSLPFFPSFLEIHLDEIPAFIAGFAYGPIAGVGIILVKTIIKLPMTSTMAVGELADLLLSGVFVGVATLIYKKWRTLKGAVVGMAIAAVVQIGVAMLLNVYMLVPFYVGLYFGGNEEAILGLMQKAIPFINNIRWDYGLFAVAPFNLLKNVVVFIITFVVYHFIHKPLRLEKKA